MFPACLTALAALPQMGGGGSFGGGGGGGGGDGGGGEIVRFLVELWIHLLIRYPALGIPLTIVVLAVLFVGFREGWWKTQERTIRRHRPERRAQASSVSAAALRANDPEFDEARFLKRVARAWDAGQASWCAQDLEPIRPFVTDGVFERLSLQVEEQRAEGWRQGMENVRRERLAIAHVELGDPFETITVRIPFRAEIDRRVLDTGARIAGSRLPRKWFAEHWTFVRRRGTRTLDGDGLIEGSCPNCGAPLRMVQSARCEYCGCLARSGQFDWVLAEITQSSEWRVEPQRLIPGFEAYRDRDPNMNVQMLEDRASVGFWRVRAAEKAGRIDPVTCIADEGFCEEFARDLDSGKYHAQCAVGSVRTLGLLAGAQEDRAVVEITWDGHPVRALAPPDAASERRLHRTLFVFARRPGQITPLNNAFTTAHCTNCGAHDAGGTSPSCPYCGAPRRGDKASWLLSRIAERASNAGRELLAEVARADDPGVRTPSEATEAIVAWAAWLARADGALSERESAALKRLARRAEVPAERLESWLEGGEPGALLPVARDRGEARRWIAELVRVALEDGQLAVRERRVLASVGATLGLEKREVRRLIRETRTRLWSDSRAARKALR